MCLQWLESQWVHFVLFPGRLTGIDKENQPLQGPEPGYSKTGQLVGFRHCWKLWGTSSKTGASTNGSAPKRRCIPKGKTNCPTSRRFHTLTCSTIRTSWGEGAKAKQVLTRNKQQKLKLDSGKVLYPHLSIAVQHEFFVYVITHSVRFFIDDMAQIANCWASSFTKHMFILHLCHCQDHNNVTSPLKIGRTPKRKTSSNLPFFGAMC